jgi:hypothetical protein
VALEEADGTFVLTPTIWRRVFFTGAELSPWVLVMMIATSAIGWAAFGVHRVHEIQWLRTLSYPVFALAVIGSLVAVICRETRWRVGRDFLETRYSLFGRTWGRSHQGGTFSTQYNYGGDLGRGRARELVVRSGAGKEVLMIGSGWLRQDLQSMGSFLAGVTGWSFDERAPLHGLGMGGGIYS